MNAETITILTNKFYKNQQSVEDVQFLLASYAQEMGNPMITGTISTILDYFQRKYNTVILTDKNNKFLKAFNYEEVNYSPDGISQENSSECQSVSCKEEQDVVQS